MNQKHLFSILPWTAAALALYVSSGSAQTDGTFNNLDVSGTTTLEGPIQMNDAAPSAAGQWNVTLINGLFIWADPAASSPLGLDFATGDTVFFWYPDQLAFRAGTVANPTGWDESKIGYGSFVFGTGDALAEGDSAFAFGGEGWASASGDYSLAFGYEVAAFGNHAFAFGRDEVYANGDSAFAFGDQFVTAVGNISFAFGKDVGTLTDFSWVFGEGLEASNHSEIIFGRFSTDTGISYNWDESTPLFRLANGTSDLDRSEALVTLKNGRTTLTNKFWDEANPDVVPGASDASEGEALVVEGHARFEGRVTMSQRHGDILMGDYGYPE